MYKFLSLIFIFSMCFLMMYSGTDSLVCVMGDVCSCIVISDNYNSQVVKFGKVDFEYVNKCLNVEIVRKFYVGNNLIIEGYTSLLKKYKIINNRKINIQISVSGDECLIGYPLIKSSF